MSDDILDAQEQADLELAIKLSQESVNPKRKVVEISSDEEDSPRDNKKPKQEKVIVYDRKTLELERLARQRSKEASGQASTSKVNSNNGPSRIATLSTITPSVNPTASSSSRVNTPELRFPTPTIRSTFNEAFPNDPNAVTFAQVRGNPATLQSSIICAMCAEPDWVMEHFNPSKPLFVILDREYDGLMLLKPDGSEQQVSLQKVFDMNGLSNFKSVIPPHRGTTKWGKMHAKFYFFRHTTYTRFVITTANLMSYDWAYIDNQCWIVDLPIPTKEPLYHNASDSPFYGDMSGFLKELTVPRCAWEPWLAHTDFAQIDKVARLCISSAGSHEENSIAYRFRQYGYPNLCRAVEELSVIPQDKEKFEIECQTSSVGEYEIQWLQRFYSSLPNARPTIRLPPITVQFPTEKQVLQSRHGPKWAISFFCKKRAWTSTPFDRMARPANCKRAGLLQHTKMIIGLIKGGKDQETERKRAFVYLGSANFTPAAWGRHKDRTARGARRIDISNTEIGIVFAVKATGDDSIDEEVSRVVPYVRPLSTYAQDDIPFMRDD